MILTWKTFLIVCPLTFLAGFIDSIAGGGGLISLPAFLMTGIPAHMAVATNKLSSSLGTSVATIRFARRKLIDWKVALPAAIIAMIGSAAGARISLGLSETLIRNLLLFILPAVALIVMNRNWFHDNPDTGEMTMATRIRLFLLIFVIGIYDGIYGPGTGTFLIIAFTMIGRMSMARANGNCKLINLCTNISSLVVYIASGKVIFTLGLAAAAANMLGNWLGSGMVMKQGSKIVRPVILGVLAIFLVKLITEML